MRNPADPVAAGADTGALHRYLDRVAKEPHRHDLFQVLRTVEALTPNLPRLGLAYRIKDEPLRIGQDAALNFAPTPISRLQRDEDGRPRLEQAVLGLLGPNGPLPLHLTDFARERILHHGDHTLVRFLDLLGHRQTLLFYRAWAQSQPATGLDRPGDDPYARYLGALVGIGLPELRGRDAAPDHLKLHFAGLLAGAARQPDSLAAILGSYFRIPVAVQPFIGHWMRIPRNDRLALRAPPRGTRRHAMGTWPLGGGALLGRTVWDRQHKFRLQLGPVDLPKYEDFLPGGSALPALVSVVRFHLGHELDWDVRLLLKKEDVPQIRLGRTGRLGYTTWLGRRRSSNDAGDLLLDASNRVAAQTVSGG